MFGTPIPAEELQIKDQSHKMAELRRMKNRLRDELEQLLADNAFAAPAVELHRSRCLKKVSSRKL